MKTILLLPVFLVLVSSGNAQQDVSLVNRVNEILKFTQVKDLEKVMDYTYPKLFTIVSRELLIKTMKETYDTDEFIIELDSAKIITVYPVFMINDTSYAKIKHSMLMKMKYKEPFDTADRESTKFLITLMEQKFGKGNVRFDATTNSVNIFMMSDMVAIKPENEWTFINLDEDNPAMLNMLLSRKVIEKLKEFK